MVALPLFDIVMSSEHAERSADVATQLVAAALAELRGIEKLDQSLLAPDPAQFDRRTAALIRGLYERWAHEAEALLDRVTQTERRFGPVTGANELRDEFGRTMAMLSVSLDDMEAARQDVAAGRLFSIEEVRRELRLEVR
jgi:hypothetical protein